MYCLVVVQCCASVYTATTFCHMRSTAGTRASGDVSMVVDLYNFETGAWSTDELSEGRSYLTAVSVGNMALFAGGYTGALWCKSWCLILMVLYNFV